MRFCGLHPLFHFLNYGVDQKYRYSILEEEGGRRTYRRYVMYRAQKMCSSSSKAELISR